MSRTKWPEFIETENEAIDQLEGLSMEELDALIEAERKKCVPVAEDPGRKWWDKRRALHASA